MAKWTPQMTPVATYEVDGQTIDAGETCIGVTRQDGTAIDPGTFQNLFETAITINQRMSAVYVALAALQPRMAGDADTGGVIATVPSANLAAAQAVVTAQFADQNVAVVGD